MRISDEELQKLITNHFGKEDHFHCLLDLQDLRKLAKPFTSLVSPGWTKDIHDLRSFFEPPKPPTAEEQLKKLKEAIGTLVDVSDDALSTHATNMETVVHLSVPLDKYRKLQEAMK